MVIDFETHTLYFVAMGRADAASPFTLHPHPRRRVSCSRFMVDIYEIGGIFGWIMDSSSSWFMIHGSGVVVAVEWARL